MWCGSRPGLALAGAILGALGLAACTDSSDPCGGVGCSSRGYCVQDQGTPYCACMFGYHPSGMACESNDPANPCDGVGCGGHGTCQSDGEQVWCECAEGYVWIADPASALCRDRECDLMCVSAELPGIPCVLEECQAWCRRRWDTPDGHCVVGFCSCLAPCDVLACQDDCEAQGYLVGICSPSMGCECSGTPIGADADADPPAAADAEPEA